MAEYEQPIVVFTDGAAKGNPGPGGWGTVIVTPDGHVTELGGGAAHTTNNQMEMAGVIRALEYLRQMPGKVAVHTDSTYVIKGITQWIWGWMKRGWKTAEGGDVLNREHWETLAALTTRRGKPNLSWHYVRGHTGVPGNERVDEIATAFAAKQRPDLYDGPLIRYPIAVLDIPDDTAVPERSATSATRGKNTPAYSYLSVVDGKPARHGSWPECERRVKGRSGARFKKAMTAADEAAILQGWGFDRNDL